MSILTLTFPIPFCNIQSNRGGVDRSLSYRQQHKRKEGKMKTALLTGFEAFGSYTANATEVLVRSLDRTTVQNHAIRSLVFPATIFPPNSEDYGRQTVTSARELGASAIISLGMASEVKGIRIESRATNWVENSKYCQPGENRRRIDDSLPARMVLMIDLGKWDFSRLFEQLARRVIPFEPQISEDANNYCCNALMFRTLRALKQFRYSIPYIYLHVSCTRASIQSIPDFDERKTIISEQQLKDMVSIVLDSYR